MTLADKLLAYAKQNPDGFTIKIKKGKILPFKPSERKRYVVSTTNNDTVRKIKASFKKDYSGYAGGWYDKKTGKYYIDKNIVIGNKQVATDTGRKYKQKAIFDLLKLKEIRLTSTKRKITNIVVKRKGKWINTITGRTVSESTAKRYNSYFRRNPKGFLSSAYGGYKYHKDIPLDKLSKKTRKLFYKDTQAIKTKDIKGKTVYYSPMLRTLVPTDVVKILDELDYTICDGKVIVKLFRLTRDNKHICHVFRWKVKKSWTSAFSLENWIYSQGIPIMNCILNEVYGVAKKYPVAKLQGMYGHIELGYYSDIDSFPKSFTFGMENGAWNRPETQRGIRKFGNRFHDVLDKSLYKLESDAYRNFYIQNITIYIYGGSIAGKTDLIARYRKGVLGVMTTKK